MFKSCAQTTPSPRTSPLPPLVQHSEGTLLQALILLSKEFLFLLCPAPARLPPPHAKAVQTDLGELAHEKAHAGSIMSNVTDCQLLPNAMTSQHQAVNRDPPTVVLHLLLLDVNL